MNIYMHVEMFVREFDSKLLLGVIAAASGHNVIISDSSSLQKLYKINELPPGIYHAKSLTPGQSKIDWHNKLSSQGILITTLDEEGYLVRSGYDDFALQRYSEHMIQQSAAVFAWGDEDSESLCRIYSDYKDKIHKVGSPRADLWSEKFRDFWIKPKSMPLKPYILISSNTGYANNNKGFEKIISHLQESKYLERDPKLLREIFFSASDDFKMMYEYIEAIKYLSERFPEIDIVYRPHPAEKLESWHVFLKGFKNVYVIRDGSINAWVNNAVAVMHNGCTTAIEAIISRKPVITYIPFIAEYDNDIPNQLGFIVKNTNELGEVVNCILKEEGGYKPIDYQNNSPFKNKVYIDDADLAVNKILRVWESLEYRIDNTDLDVHKIKKILWRYRVKENVKRSALLLKRYSGMGQAWINSNNEKFPPLDMIDVKSKIDRFMRILDISTEIECHKLTYKAIVLKRKI